MDFLMQESQKQAKAIFIPWQVKQVLMPKMAAGLDAW